MSSRNAMRGWEYAQTPHNPGVRAHELAFIPLTHTHHHSSPGSCTCATAQHWLHRQGRAARWSSHLPCLCPATGLQQTAGPACRCLRSQRRSGASLSTMSMITSYEIEFFGREPAVAESGCVCVRVCVADSLHCMVRGSVCISCRLELLRLECAYFGWFERSETALSQLFVGVGVTLLTQM